MIREDVNEVLVLLSGRDQIVVALAGCIFRTKILGLKRSDRSMGRRRNMFLASPRMSEIAVRLEEVS
jgi:hypothetical protein